MDEEVNLSGSIRCACLPPRQRNSSAHCSPRVARVHHWEKLGQGVATGGNSRGAGSQWMRPRPIEAGRCGSATLRTRAAPASAATSASAGRIQRRGATADMAASTHSQRACDQGHAAW